MLFLGRSSTLGIAKLLNPELPYDPVKDLSPVAMLGSVPVGIFGSPATGITSIEGLVAAARARPQRVRPCHQAGGRELRGVQAIVRGQTRVQRLAFGAEHRAQAGSLGGCRPDRVRCALRVQPQQVRARGRCAQHHDRAGRVEAPFVVAGRYRAACPPGELVTGDEGGDEVAPACAPLLRQRQHARQDGGAGMPAHAGVHVVVVVVEGVRGRAVDESRLRRGNAPAWPTRDAMGWPPSARACSIRMGASGSSRAPSVTPIQSSTQLRAIWRTASGNAS